MFATDDYEYLQSLLDAGLDEQAFEEMVEFLAADDLAEEQAEYEEYGDDNEQQFAAACKNVRRRHEKTAKSVFARMSRRRNPEGAVAPQQVAKMVLPQQVSGKSRLACLDEFVLLPESGVSQALDDFKQQCAESHALHCAEYMKNVAVEPERLVAESAMRELKTAVAKETVPTMALEDFRVQSYSGEAKLVKIS